MLHDSSLILQHLGAWQKTFTIHLARTAGVSPAVARASRPCARMAEMAMAQRAGSGTLPRQRARRPHYKVLAHMALL